MKEAANLAFAIQLRTTLLHAPNAQHVVYQAQAKIAATIADEAQNHDPQRVRPSQWYPKRQNHQASDHKVRFLHTSSVSKDESEGKNACGAPE